MSFGCKMHKPGKLSKQKRFGNLKDVFGVKKYNYGKLSVTTLANFSLV